MYILQYMLLPSTTDKAATLRAGGGRQKANNKRPPPDRPSTDRHVAPRADEGVGHGVDQLAGDAEVAQLYLPVAVD